MVIDVLSELLRFAPDVYGLRWDNHVAMFTVTPEGVLVVDPCGEANRNTPSLLDDIERHVSRFAGVHVADHRDPTRGWADRALPGDGDAPVADALAALEDAGWDGFYDLEIFSDDGTFGAAYPDSYWALPVDEAARRGVAAVRDALQVRARA